MGRDLYLITEGHVQVFREEAGQRIDLAIRGPGDLVGEMSLIDDSPRFATVFAREPVRALVFPDESITSFWMKHPEILTRILAVLNNRLREADLVMIADLQVKNRELKQAYLELQNAQKELVEKERMEHELDLACDLQRSILQDTFPDFPGLDIAARYLPARQVGGDFYDIIPLFDGKVGIVIADVADKGLPAAIYMALSRSLIRAEAHRSQSPREVLLSFHHLLLEITQADMFVTVFYGILDTVNQKLTYVRAGHEYPFITRKASGECIELNPKGVALGMNLAVRLQEEEISLHPGDLIVLYTDGLIEVTSPSGNIFGLDQLKEVVCENSRESSEKICDLIFQQVKAIQQDAIQYDDIALLVIQKASSG